MKTTLFRISLPSSSELPQEPLYYRGSGCAYPENFSLMIEAGSCIRTDTYFNGFFYPKYLRYTEVTTVTLSLEITGKARIRLLCFSPKQPETTLYQGEENGCHKQFQTPEIDLTQLPPDGMIFWELEALSDMVVLYGGAYETSVEPVQTVMAAVVICTFRRESYAQKNIEQIRSSIWNDAACPIHDKLDLLVIDNGNSLGWQESSCFRVLPNKNYGGSGGFTRGLLEVFCSKKKYTHVILMDDDISFETEVFVKTIQMLRFLKRFRQPVWIGGQMLMEDHPTIQYEAGGVYHGGQLKAFGRDVDLSLRENLLCDSSEYAEYNAWWYCCMPVSCIERAGLPLPLFIKMDDVEYGLRQTPNILIMNGIGIWHMSFSQKYSSHLQYYIKRNELLVSTLHRPEDKIFLHSWKLIRAAAKAVLRGDPREVDFLLRAYQDFLKGPDFFLKTDEEQLNRQLLEEKGEPSKTRIHSILTDPFRLLPVLWKLLLNYRRVQQNYQKRFGELTSVEFWQKHLQLGSGK